MANGGFAMGTAIAVRTDYASKELRGLAARVKNAAQARRLLAMAAVLDGHSRAEAAKIGGMDRQTLRDWVIRFNRQGPDGLVNQPSPGGPSKLTDEHKTFLVRIVEEGPTPAIHGVVRWRACDLIMRLQCVGRNKRSAAKRIAPPYANERRAGWRNALRLLRPTGYGLGHQSAYSISSR
jgi:transposase